MFSKFTNLKPEKQERILNAAFKEFAQKGYKNASTDVIVKEAAISKGAPFHYFNNKKDLFLFLYDYSLNIVTNEIQSKLDFQEKDIFAKRRQASHLKIEILKKHPEMYDFLAVAYMDDCDEVKIELDNRSKQAMARGQMFLNEGIDTTKFIDGIDVKRATDIITWSVEGFINREMLRIKKITLEEINYDELFDEMDIYLEMLKKSFYK